MRLTLLSRASDLARIQALLVGRAIIAVRPDIDVTYLTRTAAGDRDAATPLANLPSKGVFTADLSDALAARDADAVVHSWKDLPLEGRPDTLLAATLERADPRDLLLVRRDVVQSRPSHLSVLSSSPRRTWLLEGLLPALLPWPVEHVTFSPVRGNITTRLTRLGEGRGDALVVAKAALDRLLTFGAPFERTAASVRASLALTHWMVLPIRDVPCAAAQGALAVEISTSNPALVDLFRAISHTPTWQAVMQERAVLGNYGGGCHAAVGATVLPHDYGRVLSVRARGTDNGIDTQWSLMDRGSQPPRADASSIWPGPEERHLARRRLLDVPQPADDRGWWVSRAEALPAGWTTTPDRIVWAAGGTTWRKLATRGIWVHGSADGLGDSEPPRIEALAGRAVAWHRLTHADVDDPQALATYIVDETLPDDLASRSHFFWTSGTAFRRAIARWPALGDRWHGSGPGRTWQTIRDVVGPSSRVGAWLDYDDWRREVTE